ncbi:MAG: PAS domain S-box protein, partial [Anaerolineae bacterium]|nr:PAS domain S-box protein [Anaerolineae bacterium]
MYSPDPDMQNLAQIYQGMVYLFDLKSYRFFYLNPQVMEILDYAPEVITSLNADETRLLFHPDDLQFISLNRSRLETHPEENFQVFQYRMRHRDGSWRWLACRETRFTQPEQADYLILGLAQDITPAPSPLSDIKNILSSQPNTSSSGLWVNASNQPTTAELEQRIKERTKALQQAEGALRAFMDAIPESAFLIDPEGSILSANSTFAQRLEVPVDDLPGRNIYELLDKKTSSAMHNHTLQVLRSGVPARFTDERGARIIDNLVYPVFDGDGRVSGLAMMGFDITERKLAEEALAQQARELARSNAELEQFAYVASHDLQEPLRMVASFTQLLSERYKGQLDERADQYIGFAVEGASYMQNLIDDMLSYSRVTTRAKPFRVTSFENIVQKAMSNLRVTIHENNAEVNLGPLPTLPVDENQMVQLFQNLIGNAIKFHTDLPPRIFISASQENDEWIFAVKDNGIGIDPRYFERIFVI